MTEQEKEDAQAMYMKAHAERKALREKQEEQARKGSFKFIMGYAKNQCCSIILGCIFLIGGILAELAMPIFIGEVIEMMKTGDFDGVSEACLWMVIITIVSLVSMLCLIKNESFFKVSGLSTFMRSAIFNILSERVSRNLRKDYFEAILNMDIAFFDEKRTGELSKYFVTTLY